MKLISLSLAALQSYSYLVAAEEESNTSASATTKTQKFEHDLNELAEKEGEKGKEALQKAKEGTGEEERIGARSLIVQETQSIFNLQNYGCWCHADLETGESLGHGQPQDEFDRLCKRLYDGYECIRMDNVDSKQQSTCIPSQTHYKVAALDISRSAKETCDLTRHEMNSCQYETCIVELSYVLEVFKLYINRVYPNRNYKHRKSADEFGFDFEGECQVPNANLRSLGGHGLGDFFGYDAALLQKAQDYFNYAYIYSDHNQQYGSMDDDLDSQADSSNDSENSGGNHWPEKMCCGSMPNRHPFKPEGGKKRCCKHDGKTFEFKTMVCCAEGVMNSCA